MHVIGRFLPLRGECDIEYIRPSSARVSDYHDAHTCPELWGTRAARWPIRTAKPETEAS